MNKGFQRVLDYLISAAENQARQGREFERLMKAYFIQDPLYEGRFSDVWLWSEWAKRRSDFDASDTGIDLVAKEKKGGYCAVQCKCHSPGTRISKKAIDSFISASDREPFTSRMVVDTGAGWGPNAKKTIEDLKTPCSVMRFSDLAARPIDWPNLVRARPEDLVVRRKPFGLHRHQQQALNSVVRGFEKHDRGKLIMACGTGKTFTALRIAERMAGAGGRVLYLVPSISLFAQAMREWAMQRRISHRYIGVCSDTRAGSEDEDASLQELEIPVSTDLEKTTAELRKRPRDAMTVVFCTYQSLDIIRQAQAKGAPAFDLALCDEAHRTTGVDRPGDRTSPFVLVHDDGEICAKKRLYMTATPRLYTEGAKAKAANRDAEVFSMDDSETYGPEFHCLPFSRAVEQNLLSDYKVVVLAISEQCVDPAMQEYLAEDGTEIGITDAAKIIGCWRALQNPESRSSGNGKSPHLARAIAFTNTIKSSRRLAEHWGGVVQNAIEQLPDAGQDSAFRCETDHVDGKSHALDRKAKIEWLKGDSENACRILSNARCLSEGIDVPALDAVLFMSPKNSPVDIVQAVGRAMRKSRGKKYGYIVLPVAVPANTDPTVALDDNERFAAVWSVLRALRSHDDRFDAEINKIDLNRKPTKRIIFSVVDEPDADNGSARESLTFPLLDIPPDAIFAKIVEKCGDRKYWETWAKDVADIFERLVQRVRGLLGNPENAKLVRQFGRFHKDLRESINSSISRDDAVNMMAQHVLTRPVFEALFDQYDFAASNPVAKALDKLHKQFVKFGLESETQGLESFYRSVQMRAQGLDSSAARQRVLMELYEKFFATAMKKDAARLGIVYTPVEVVDFILKSADHVLREEFGRSISDKNVHVLDPFTGTGIFLARLLQPELGLIQDSDFLRKYRRELHANELVLLAYYIATVHIEEAFHGRCNARSSYEPFGGIALTDTFNLHTERTGFPKDWLPDNSKRVERQQKTPIQVIIGNPPWSAGQRSSADENPNTDYPEMEQRVADTYVAQSTATLKNSLYDTYKMAIRWASDRIKDEGVVAFVTNGSWIDGNADSGVRACLAKEFNSIHVLNLRGNQRTQGELSRREGGKVFGQGSRAPVAITILVRNPNAGHEGCSIHYHDIGDYLKREEKLSSLQKAESIAGVEDWQTIVPNAHYDWINQRHEAFQALYPIGLKTVKAGKSDEAIFRLYSRGYATSRDAYIYSFSKDACAENARKMVENYRAALAELENLPNATRADVEDIARHHSSNLRWDLNLRNNLRSKKSISYQRKHIVKCQYRPFVKQHCYLEYVLANSKYQMDRVFPFGVGENRAICVTGKGSTKTFSALVTDTMPDLELISKSQCFPRYRYILPQDTVQNGLLSSESSLERIDNITDIALQEFRARCGDPSINKDDIFDYVYGVLHAPDYGRRFANDLAKELPRIPIAENFRDFIKAGRKLASLHLGYETCEEVPLEVVPICDRDPLEIEPISDGDLKPEDFRIGAKKMGFTDTKYDTLRVNDHIGLRRIPAAAQAYKVNGRTPLEWLIDRYRVTRDKESGIVNDPNDWFADPRDIVSVVGRLAYVSKESAGIIARLPDLVADELRDIPYEPSHAELCRRDSIIIATSPQEPEDQAFIDAVTDWSE